MRRSWCMTALLTYTSPIAPPRACEHYKQAYSSLLIPTQILSLYNLIRPRSAGGFRVHFAMPKPGHVTWHPDIQGTVHIQNPEQGARLEAARSAGADQQVWRKGLQRQVGSQRRGDGTDLVHIVDGALACTAELAIRYI